MKSRKKEFQQTRRSASIATLFVTAIALVMLGLSLSHGSGKAMAETRAVAAPVASSGENGGAIASADTDEMNSTRRLPGHSELNLQLD